MKVLFVTYDFPYPTNTGGKNRAFHLLKYAAKKADIILYSFVREDFNPEHIEILKEIGVKEIKIFKRRKLKDFSNISSTIINRSSIFRTLYFEKEVVNELENIIREHKIDIVHFESSYTGFYINSDISKLRVKLVLGTENIEHTLYLDYARKSRNLFIKPLLFYQAERLKKEEEKMIKKADAVTAITQDEAKYIESVSKRKCYVVGNGVDVADLEYKHSSKNTKNLLFVGNFSYFPNIDAMNFFYNEVFKNLPEDITLTIVGKRGKEVLGYDNERVIFKEFVADIVDEYRDADMLIFPVRIGGGTNFKVLEAMALGIPIVANPDRLSGLKAVAETHFLEARNADSYVNQIKRLYDESELREMITRNARKLVEENFTWEKISLSLIKTWKEVF